LTENAWSFCIVALGLVQERREHLEGLRELVVGGGGGERRLGARDQVAERRLVRAERPEHRAAVLHQADHGLVLHIQDLEDVGRVGRERRQVAEHVVQVLVVAPDRLGELLLPDLERMARRRIERVVDVRQLHL
jgi:hypothetical protein